MESVQVPYEETGALSPEQQAAADAAAAAPAVEPVVDADRPAWLPDKFATVEDMAKSHKELESKLGGKKGELTIPDPVADGAIPQADMDFYSQRYAENGALDATDYEGLKKLGISKSMADGYVEGQRALAHQYEQGVYAQAGGPEAYAAMTTWASESLDDAEVAIFNTIVESGDATKTASAVKGLLARYTLENGAAPTLMRGKTGGSGSEAYASLEQMKSDMRDPRYHKDPAFRAVVTRKLANSNIM